MAARVLLVEDQPSDRALVAKALQGVDLELLYAATAEEAFRYLEEDQIALVLLDIHLPGICGEELALRLKETQGAQMVPVIFVTGEDNPQALERYELEAIDCLSKPINPAVLRSKVRVFCELQRQKEIIQQQVRALERQKRQLQSAVQEREEAEEALQESEVRYRALLELSPVATVVQADNEMLYVNTAVLDLVCAEKREDLLGKSMLDLFTPATLAFGREYVSQLERQGGRLPPMEAEWQCQDGRIIHVQVSGACILYCGRVGVQFAIVDITERKRLEQELQELSLRDPLTLLHNRRSLDDVLDRECRKAKRNKTPLAMLLMDIDNFKAYNDEFGHQKGDHILQIVAAEIEKEALRAGDHVARYGGEEFCMILPETTLRGGRTVGERIRARIEKLGVAPAPSATYPVLTISVGVAQVPPDAAATPEQLVLAADKALYQAKHSGRNCVKSVQF